MPESVRVAEQNVHHAERVLKSCEIALDATLAEVEPLVQLAYRLWRREAEHESDWDGKVYTMLDFFHLTIASERADYIRQAREFATFVQEVLAEL